MKITFVIGLPASGKTTYINNKYSNIENTVIIDDPQHKYLVANYLEYTKKYNTHLIIIDPYFCIKENLKLAIDYLKSISDFEVEKIYFENNSEQCIINSKNREDKKVESFIRLLSKRYNPPNDVVPIYKTS